MLNYINDRIREEITNVLIGESGEDDIEVVEMLDATKADDTVTEKVLWPGPAMQLFMTTNKDNASPRLAFADNIYGGPVLTPGESGYQALRITVTPYPPGAAWKVRGSAGMGLSNSIETGVFCGTQTLTISMANAAPQTTEERWIEAYPAYKGSACNAVRFRFWVRNNAAASSGEGEGEGEGGSTTQAPEGAAYYWSFDGSASSFLLDSAHGADLWDYRNPTTIASHIMKMADGAMVGTALRAVTDAVDTEKYIRVGTTNYRRKSTADANSKYAWHDLTNNLDIFTESETPAVGAAVYDSSDNLLTGTVLDYFTPNGNIFSTTVTAQDGTTDWTSPVTYSFFLQASGSGRVTMGGIHMDWNWGNAAMLVGSNGNIIGQAQKFAGLERLGSHGWLHVAFAIEKKPTTYAEMLYTPQKGYGLVSVKGLRTGSNNSAVGPYYRDTTKDADGRYAWSYYTDATLNNSSNTGPAEGHETIWTDAAPDDIAFGTNTQGWWSSSSTANGDKVTATCYHSQWHLRHDTLAPKSAENQTLPYIYNEGHDNPKAYGQPALTPLVLGYYNGELWWLVNSTRTANPFGTFGVRFGGTTNKAAIDEIKVSYHMYSPTEASADCSKIGFDSDTVLDNSKAADIGFSMNGLRKEFPEYKITVDSSDYIYDPLSTIYYPTAAQITGAHFGWEKISGAGADHIWTDTLEPVVGTGVFVEATDAAVDDNHPITAKESMMPSDVPIESYLSVFFIDESTLCVIADTHDWIMKRIRSRFPNIEAIHWFSYRGSFGSNTLDYKGQGNFNFLVWKQHSIYQPLFISAFDNVSNWDLDGDPVSIVGRWWECIGLFYPNGKMQFRNCEEGDPFYVTERFWRPSVDYVAGDFAHVAYIHLPTPMTEGSTHTITWNGVSRTFTYGREGKGNSIIKVNQEGYRTHGRRYAYMGGWLGSAGPYVHSLSDLHFYLVPTSCKYYDVTTPAVGAVFSGEMTQRCAYFSSSAGLPTSDVYGDKPLDGENTFEMDFTNFASMTKQRLTVGSKTYLRNTIQDYTYHTLTTSLGTYNRDDSRDTCNAYAYVAADANNAIQILYTATEVPTTSTTLWLDYEQTQAPEGTYTITGVTAHTRYGWTEERTDLADNWWTAETVWTGNNQDNTATPDTTQSVGAIYTTRCSSAYNMAVGYIDTVTTADTAEEYQIYIPHIGWSHKFEIGPSGLGHAFWIHARGLFHQRSGCGQVKHPYTNWEYDGESHSPVYDGTCIRDGNDAVDPNTCWQVDPETHETILTAAGGKTALSGSTSMFTMSGDAMNFGIQRPMHSVRGGWFDAADFDMKPEHLIGIEALSEAYINYPDNFTDNQLDLPESNDGVPDILSEAIWGAELYRRGQFADGGVGTWFETNGHESDWPWLSTKKYYRVAGDYYGTIYYVRVIAQLAKALNLAASRATTEAARTRCRELASLYTDSALRGWDYFAKEFTAPWTVKADADRTLLYIQYKGATFAYRPTLTMQSGTFISQTGVHAFNAAVALYDLTREARFKPWITLPVWNQIIAWLRNNENRWGQYIAWGLLKSIKDDFPDVSAKMISDYLSTSASWKNRQEQHTYRLLHFGPTHTYFKNLAYGCSHPDMRGPLYMAMDIATDDSQWIDELALAMDHVEGCNAMGRCWTNGMGKVSINRQLDHWLPRSMTQRDMWTGRPGITQYFFCAPTISNSGNCYKIAVSPANSGRSDFNASATQFDVFPADLTTRYSASRSNLSATVINKLHPVWRCLACFEVEGLYVGESEYTVWETIMWKVAFSGVLMGKGFKPKPSHKQIAPAIGHDNEPRHVFVP